MLLINHDLLPSQVLAPAVVPARLVGPFTGAADCGQAGQLSCRHPRTQPAAGGRLICPVRVPAVALAPLTQKARLTPFSGLAGLTVLIPDHR